MFKKYLNSKHIKSTHGTFFIDCVSNFITKHIEPRVSNFCFYLGSNLRYFDEYTNSIHEETNHKLKFNTAPNCQSTKIKKAMAIMCKSAKHNRKRKSRVTSINFRGTKVYSKLKSGNQFKTIGEGILYHSWIKKFPYKKLKISPSKW